MGIYIITKTKHFCLGREAIRIGVWIKKGSAHPMCHHKDLLIIFTARFRRTRGLVVTFYREIPKDSRSSSHFFTERLLSWSHREEEEGEGERSGPTVRRKRERGEGWSHREEEEGEGRGLVPPCGGRVSE